MCTTRHTLEPFLRLKTVLDKSASSLSEPADCHVSTPMVRCGCESQRCSDIPQAESRDASGSDMKNARLCAQLPHQRFSLLLCSLVRWTAFLCSLQGKKTWQNISELRVHQLPNLACLVVVQWGKAKLMWRGCQAGHLFPLQSPREYLVSRGAKRGAGVCISCTAASAIHLFWAMCLSSYT